MSSSVVVRRRGAALLALALASSACVSQTQQSHKLNNNSPAAYIAVGGILLVGGGILTYDAGEHPSHYNYDTSKLFVGIGIVTMLVGAIGIVRGALMYSVSSASP
ncbi:MAG TPA: hypothetical protein VGM88_15540 [Kofleriaceae bacterium]|jgi:hypothetical protein